MAGHDNRREGRAHMGTPTAPPPEENPPATQPTPVTEPPEATTRGPRPWLVVTIVAVVVVVCLGGLVSSVLIGVNRFRHANPNRPATLGQTVRDGGLEFTVDEVTCGTDDELLGTNPQGQYCVASIAARNVGRTPETFDVMWQRAFAPNGTEFAADEQVSFFVNAGNPSFDRDINPGNHIRAYVVYDIPADNSISRLDLHASDSSRGVEVKVS
jgi:hypothetical protein